VNGAVAGLAGLTAHGLVDFNLRIPSNATMFVALAALAVAPRGSGPWRGPGRWGLPVALAVVGVLWARSADPAPILREARAFAVKAHAEDRTPLRAVMAERRVRDYLGRRPADPEGWLLAGWSALVRGDAEAGAALSRHAITLDPDHAAVREAAASLAGGSSTTKRGQ
jgi:hypothetical protein